MKKSSLVAFVFIILGMISSFKPAVACSLYLDPDTQKDEFIGKLSTYLSVPSSSIHREDLTRPAFTFLESLGADCSGLDRAIITSGYQFKINKNFQSCTYKGVIIAKAEGAADEFFVNADTKVCVPLIRSFPPIRFPRPGVH